MSRVVRFGQLAASDIFNITGSLFGTSSWARSSSYSLFATSASFSSTASYSFFATSASFSSTASYSLTSLHTASVNNATITFTKGNGSIFPITINNVANSISASHAVTASYALNSAGAGFPFSGSAIITGSLEIKSNVNNVFLIKNFNNEPILTVSQSGTIIIATQSFDPTGSAPNGALYFTSASFFIGLD